jgi:hypothetical protein
MLKVYLASPYSIGNKEHNVLYAMKVARDLRKLDLMVYEPLLYHFADKEFHEPYDYWMKVVVSWLKACDCVLRLPGTSAGADRETLTAQRVGIPVFTSIDDLITYKETGKYNANPPVQYSL